MAVNVNDVKTLVEALVQKDQKTLYLSATEFNLYAKAAQLDVINNQRMLFEAGSISADNLSDLKTVTDVNVDPDTGQLTKPSDMLYTSAMYVNAIYTNKRGNTDTFKNSVDLIGDAEYANRMASLVSPPTKQRPIAVEYSTYYQLYPYNVGVVQLVYISDPADPVWAYTTSGGFQVYDSGNSVQFELPEQLRNDLVYKICEYMGVSVRQQDLVQSANLLKANQ